MPQIQVCSLGFLIDFYVDLAGKKRLVTGITTTAHRSPEAPFNNDCTAGANLGITYPW